MGDWEESRLGPLLRAGFLRRFPQGPLRMIVGFSRKPHDLLVVVALCLALVPLVAFDVLGPIRTVLALAFVLILPGYALTAFLFPKDGDVRWIERIALSVGLSIAAVMLLAVALIYTPWGFRPESIFSGILALTVGLACLAYRRRMRLAPNERLALSINVTPAPWRQFTTSDRILAGILVASLVLAGGFAAISPGPPAAERFTEFFMLDSEGGVSDYPSVLNVSEEGTIRIGITNHERRTLTYAVQVHLVKVTFVDNQTVELSNVTLDELSAPLEDAGRWDAPYAFRIPEAGDFRVWFFLFAGPVHGAPYKTLYLTVRVV